VSRGLIVVAAGSSIRMGGVDKVWADLGGSPMVQHSLQRLAPAVDRIVLVVREEDVTRARDAFAHLIHSLEVVAGGDERQSSVSNGLTAMGDCEVVAVHDAARPFAGPDLIEAGLTLLGTADGAVPAERVSDTIKIVDGDRVLETVNRDFARVVQTPQIFRADSLRRAHVEAQGSEGRATDDAGLLERLGLPVRVFPGRQTNFKVTTPFDLRVARLLLASETRP
jgi:2-C-methyl-D-erythritol 4-phosphate cytidylyltransferase